MKLVASLDSNRGMLSWGPELNITPTGTTESIEVDAPPRDLKRPTLDNDNVTWIEAPDSVPELQDKKLIEIKEAFEVAKEATVTYRNNDYDITPESKQNLIYLITMMQLDNTIATVKWRDATNTNRTLLLADLIALGVLAVKQEQDVRETYWSLKDRLLVANTKIKVRNVVWPVV
jgi:hypothetical protein